MRYLLLTVMVSMFTLGYSAKHIQQEYTDYKMSIKCVQHYVQLGHERSTIAVAGSTCYIK